MSESANNRAIMKVASLSSFIGMLAAIPVYIILFISGQQANATAQTDTQTNNVPAAADANYAMYAHAYNEGYLANTVVRNSVVPATSCSSPVLRGGGGGGGENSWSPKRAYSHYSGSALKANGVMNGSWGKHKGANASYAKWVQHVSNNYRSSEDNSTTSYINSNNTVGSHNTSTSSSETNVEVKDSEDVAIHTETKAESENESHYEGNTEISDSGNTTTEYKEETNIEDSFNTETEVNTEIDTDIEIENKHEEENTEINDSFNKEENVELGFPHNSL